MPEDPKYVEAWDRAEKDRAAAHGSIRRWADEQQYVAAPIEGSRDGSGNIVPRVHLLTMTPDPLGAIAAMCRMYEGKPTYSMGEISDEERRHYFAQAQATHLRAPLEAVKFHFFIEGVTRSFTHQMVRQRTAVYAQESMRFAVKENLAAEISLPPSIAALKPNHPTRQVWDDTVEHVSHTYNYLVANGIPAEDARGLAPHATTTRLNYITDLRNLSDHAGNRLCTQAQFEWRIVFLGIVAAIRDYRPDFSSLSEVQLGGLPNAPTLREHAVWQWDQTNRWQFEELASSGLFRPVCYQLGKCPFKATFDRACSIRERVEVRADHGGKDPTQWHKPFLYYAEDGKTMMTSKGIDPREWLADPAAARSTSGGGGHD